MSKENDIWVCEYCDAEFETEGQVNRHEAKCQRKILRIKGKVKPVFDLWQGVKLGLGFGIGFAISSAIIFLTVIILFGSVISGILFGNVMGGFLG